MRRFASRLAVYFGLIDDDTHVRTVRPPMTARGHAWALVTTLASLLVVTFLIWGLIDEDSFPDALLIPTLVAVAISIADTVARIVSERRQRGASS
jgi:hypothetical protein